MAHEKKGVISLVQEFSIPLMLGVVVAVVWANLDYESYHHVVEFEPFGHSFQLFHHHFTLHFLINDIFMVFFFGIAAKEITESVLPGGALNPPSKAINPLLGTIGGVVGPIIVFLLLAGVFISSGAFDSVGGGYDSSQAWSSIGRAFSPGGVFEAPDPAAIHRGWGVPTATDIALAWLVARLVFGAAHPAVNFLLLLAIADDAIGLIIIAVFYPNPEHPVEVQYLLLVLAGMAVAYALRKKDVQNWIPYIAIGGTLSWLGLLNASIHPALALVPIVPFLPGPKRDTGMYAELDEVDELSEVFTGSHESVGDHHSPLHNFEHQLKLFVDFGLFFFGLANAGVAFAGINAVTWTILLALLVGKTVGITFFAWIGNTLGFPYPTGMTTKHIVVAAVIAGMGLTVALFVSGEAYPGAALQGAAKMGALFSAGAAALAFLLGRIFKVSELEKR